MEPRLIAVSGKPKGTIFALTEKEMSIGRDTTNAICLNEASVSRRHCLIEEKDDNRFFVRDRESFNGIFVNGTPVSEQEIKHGDLVGIGDVLLFFLTEETESESVLNEKQLAIIKDKDLNNQSTVKLARQDAVYLFPEKLLDELPQMARTAKDLSALLKISSAINQIVELEALQQKLLELTAEVIPAQRGAILLVDGGEHEIASSFVWTLEAKKQKKFHVSHTVIEKCLKESVSVLCNDINEDEDFRLVESLAVLNIHSILCVPLIMFEKTLGVIYLDTSDVKAVFDQDHLQLLTGIAGIAADPLENAKQTERLKRENQRLLAQLDSNRRIIGESDKIEEIFSLIARIAPTDSSVLILGESGTGKELAARSVHQNSHRSDNPFIAINCATLTDNLLESELFGHERGAFTGAITAKKGQFELAGGGTVFLDEIGELSVHLQAKLLRVLQEREITRLGGIKPIKIDVRLIAATNKNLEEAIGNGTFRDDLYYRLNVITLKMPALRERLSDIPLLTRFFINKYNEKCKRNIKGISPEATACLQNYNWAGNVRELENVIERAVILTQNNLITIEDLPDKISNLKRFDNGENLTYQEAVSKAKQIIVEEAIAKADGNIAKAAVSLGIHPNNLHRLLKTMSIRK